MQFTAETGIQEAAAKAGRGVSRERAGGQDGGSHVGDATGGREGSDV